MANIIDTFRNKINNLSKKKETSVDNRIDVTAQCKIIWYQWENELQTQSDIAFGFKTPTPAAFLAKSRSYDISNHIESCTYSKAMGGAAGSFSFTLNNSFDWAKFMRPGQWLVIFMSNDGDLPLPAEGALGSVTNQQNQKRALLETLGKAVAPLVSAPKAPLPEAKRGEISKFKKRMRCVGMIQRVGIRSSTNMDGTIETSFVITGKDHGGIYEDTELWFNANNSEAKTFETYLSSTHQQFVRNLSALLDTYHDIFLNISKVLPQNISSFLPKQWIMPDLLLKDLELKVDGEPYFGNIVGLKEFSPTLFELPDPSPFSNLQGRVWDKMKNVSQPEFHELFTELSDNGNPKLFFRPIPWALDKKAYPTVGSLMLSYADLASGKAILPPAPIGSLGSSLKSLSANFLNGLVKQSDLQDVRLDHSFDLGAEEIEGYDVGPDYHSRANFFLVDTMQSIWDQQNSYALISKFADPSFPFRDENDIKRHGFKPLFVNLVTFNITNNQFFGKDDPKKSFMLEANNILKDFYANAEDFYSGTINLAAGRNEVKLGKVARIDEALDGLGNMVFYVEGYADTFSVNMEGTGTWTQSLNVTRGLEISALSGKKSSKDRQRTKAETFHINQNQTSKDESTLGKIKSGIKNPREIF